MNGPESPRGHFIGRPPEIKVYGTRWCAATQMVRRYMDRVGINYSYHDIESDPGAADQVRWWTGGSTSHPTVQIGGQILVEPSTSEVEWVLRQQGWSY